MKNTSKKQYDGSSTHKLSEIISEDTQSILENLDALSRLKGRTVLVTGASGLIGTYILATLKRLSKKISFRLNVATYNDVPNFLNDFLDYKTARIFKGDLTDYTFCNNLPRADFIIHAAGYAQPGRFLTDQVKTLQINTFTTFLLFNRLNPKGTFLFVSSSEVYSGLPNPPFKESQIGVTNTNHPRACYIEGKRCGEAICCAYRLKGIDAKIARLSLAYGPGTRKNDSRVLNSLISQGLKGCIRLLDQGQAKRRYLYVSDAVEILFQILLKGEESIYNVGGHSEITISELAKKIGKYLQVPVLLPKKSIAALVGFPNEVHLHMGKVRKEFGKKKYISFNEGLKRTIEWQKLLYNQ